MKATFGILFLFLLLNPFMVKASDLLNPDSERTYFFQLIGKFNNEAKPITDVKEILGWTTGRCFDLANPSSAYGALLFAQYVDLYNGPMFPPKDLRFFIVADPDRTIAADHYDKLELYERPWVESSIKSLVPEIKTEEFNGEWQSQYSELNYFMQIRKLDSYYIAVLKLNYDVDQKKNPNSPLLKKGDIFASCYFFKKVK
ncbi:MAG: hypothetical protein ACXVCP_03470 [Bdellovibrio sp.]